jgi:pectin methylesterase-like acyl-CoA thioesterase
LKKVVLGVMLTVLFLCVSTFKLSTHRAQAATIIFPSDGYQTIQQAIDAAANGDTILVEAGTYNQSVVIDSKLISLIGENATITPCTG